MNDSSEFRILIEKVKAAQEVHQIKLPVSDNQLTPVFSKEAIDLHYGILYKNYVTKALAGEGEFQVAGAQLHTLFFEQFQAPKSPNNPAGAAKILIEDKFGNFQKLKDEITEIAMDIRGSGWVYLDTKGVIKTIVNHELVDNVSLIIDMWEHSYQFDYLADKEKYLKNIWRVLDWHVINRRLNSNA
jgi:Fe-Mn family superoxide dismutase